MTEFTSESESQFRRMREVAREIFGSALKNASIESAFTRDVHCERRVLRIGDDLHDLDSYQRLFVVSIGKAAHTMAAALEAQMGKRPRRHRGIVGRSGRPSPRLPIFSRRASYSHGRIHPSRRCHPQGADFAGCYRARDFYDLRRRIFDCRKAGRVPEG